MYLTGILTIPKNIKPPHK